MNMVCYYRRSFQKLAPSVTRTTHILDAVAVRPAGRCCQPSVVVVTCQLATHAGHPAVPNMLDIPDSAAARPAYP